MNISLRVQAGILALAMAVCLAGGYYYRDKTATSTAAIVKVESLKQSTKPIRKRIKASTRTTDSLLSRATQLADSAIAASQSPTILLPSDSTAKLSLPAPTSTELPRACIRAAEACRTEIANRDTIIAKQDSTIEVLETGPSKGGRVKSFVKTVVAWEAMKKYGPPAVKFLVKAVVR